MLKIRVYVFINLDIQDAQIFQKQIFASEFVFLLFQTHFNNYITKKQGHVTLAGAIALFFVSG